MPFTTEPIFPPIAPDVRIFFTGLMLIKPAGDKKTCEVWVHRGAPEHELTIEVRQKQALKPDVILMRHIGPLPYAFPKPGGHDDDPKIHGFELRVRTTPKGVKSYTGPDIPPQGIESIAEAINFQSSQYHDGRVGGVDAIGGRPSILLDDGLFYTAEKTSRDTDITLERDGMSPVPIDPIANLIGANIYLDPGDGLLVRWHAQGILKQLDLNKPAVNSGISYEIYVINDPLFESESELTGSPPHDEFEEYYKLLREVGPAGAPLRPFRLEHQFRLKITPPGGAPRKGSTTIPCMPGLIDP